VDKGTATRQTIVGTALGYAARHGLASVTFGALAEELRMSKSGLFAHFKAKEALQRAVLDEAGTRFHRRVIAPALTRPPGRERLASLFANYLDWMGDGCVYSTVAQEIDKLPEGVAGAFREGQRRWQRTIEDLARDAAGPQRAPDLALQFVGLSLAFQQAMKVFGDDGVRRRVAEAFQRAMETT
jgi:AcrR family transcriptional regulator